MHRNVFTPQEQMALLFLTATLLLGTGVLVVDAWLQRGLEDFRVIPQAVEPPAARSPLNGDAAMAAAIVAPSVPLAATSAVLTVSINDADVIGLQALPGIGPRTALAIVEHRRRLGAFASIDGLLDVRGIGPRTLERLRPLLRLH